MWLIVNCKNGISSYEIHRAIGVTQKTAWFMLHRIREAMQAGTFEKLSGEVESDETFIGGKAIYQHKWRREGKGRGSEGKTAVQGTIQRGGKVIATVVPNLRSYTIKSNVLANVEPGSVLYTDAFKSYWGLGRTYDHKVIDHMVSYVEGEVHTNSIENFWSCLKRTLGGTYISVEPYHLMRYVEEQTFRFNERKGTDSTRFNLAASQVAGKRLTYKKLTGKEDTLLLGTSLDS